jgi:drug/metabolite transporter (DMT)-like permease
MTDPVEPSCAAAPSRWAIVTAFLIIYLSWGTTYYATGHAMRELHMPPALFGGVRLILAGLILLAYQSLRGHSVQLTRNQALQLLPVSVCLFLLGNWLINLGQQGVESGVAAILIATTPLWIGLFGMLWPGGERLFGRGWLGLIIGFVGIVITMAPNLQDGFSVIADHHPLLVLGSAASWGFGSLLSRQLNVPLPHLTSAAYQMILGGLCQTTLGTFLGEWPDFLQKIDGRSIAAFVYLLIVGSLTGFVAFNWLLGHVSAAKVGTYAYVNPVIAVFIGWIMDETAVHVYLLASIAVILVGVYLVRSDHVPSQEIELEPD